MKKLLNESEKDRIRLLYESKGIILSEDSIFGSIARKALNWVGKNEDDIALLFKTSERALAKSLDDIIGIASKQKNISALDNIQMKLMHIYNPSALKENIPEAQRKMINFLNGYSKSKGKTKWSEIRDEVSGVTPQPKPANAQPKPANDDFVQVRQNPVGGIFGNKLSGKRISNRSFETTTDWYKDIDSSKITNWKGSIDNYNKIIANAIKTGNYEGVSRGGFEKFGIMDFRKFLQNNISKVNEVDPSIGRWSVTFK
jgi:hypothetical protein